MGKRLEDANMSKKAYCRYCNGEMELSSEETIGDGESYTLYWYECPICGSKAPISNTKKGALDYAVNGYES